MSVAVDVIHLITARTLLITRTGTLPRELYSPRGARAMAMPRVTLLLMF